MSLQAEQFFSLALARQAAGDLTQAIAFYRQVLRMRPDSPEAYVNLAHALHRQGRLDLAIVCCRQAAALRPGFAPAFAGMGDLLALAGRTAEAFRSYGWALCLQPDFVDACNNLGNALADRGRPEQAVAVFRHALSLNPAQPQPYHNYGAALLKLDRLAEAAASCRRSLTIEPANADAENNLGNALMELGHMDEALDAFGRALLLRPDRPEACINLSGALIDLGRAEAGMRLCRHAIAIDPTASGVYNNLANAFVVQRKLAAAAQMFQRALAIEPDYAQAHANYAAVLLKQGFLRDGWEAYEWRRRTPEALATARRFVEPEWDGSPLQGRTVLAYAEQGFGDAIQFSRYTGWLAAQGARVVLQLYEPLVRLGRSLPGVAEVIAFGQPPPVFDCHVSLMSLPRLAGTGLDDVPAPIPYLHPARADICAWRDRLRAVTGLRVGLVWSGAPRPQQRGAHLLDRRRSIPLAAFAGLAAIENVTWISLQKGPPAAQAASSPPPLTLLDATADLWDFADTAALIANLDLVISVDTAVAHLAGALGKPVWILSRFDGCWRWLEDRTDSPWYPSARLFHQTRPGDWREILTELAEALAGYAA